MSSRACVGRVACSVREGESVEVFRDDDAGCFRLFVNFPRQGGGETGECVDLSREDVVKLAAIIAAALSTPATEADES